MVLPGTTPGAPRGMMDFLISTAAGFGLVVGFIFLVFVTIFLVGAWFCIIDATIERPNRLTNVRIRKRIVELMASGFAPPLAHIYGGAGVAVDGAGKRVFLANAKVMKLYGIEDVINVESDFADEFPPKTSAIRLWVRDLESPFFEIKDMTSTKLRQIDSLLSVMLESRAADSGNEASRPVRCVEREDTAGESNKRRLNENRIGVDHAAAKTAVNADVETCPAEYGRRRQVGWGGKIGGKRRSGDGGRCNSAGG
jgi:hypothetical protein